MALIALRQLMGFGLVPDDARVPPQRRGPFDGRARLGPASVVARDRVAQYQRFRRPPPRLELPCANPTAPPTAITPATWPRNATANRNDTLAVPEKPARYTRPGSIAKRWADASIAFMALTLGSGGPSLSVL